MNYEGLLNLLKATNEWLTKAGKPYRLKFMTQNNHTRITIEVGTPQQLEGGTNEQTLAFYLSVKEATLWMRGWSACLLMDRTHAAPVDQAINAGPSSAITPDMAQELLNSRERVRMDRIEALRLIDYGKAGNRLTDLELYLIRRIFKDATIDDVKTLAGQ